MKKLSVFLLTVAFVFSAITMPVHAAGGRTPSGLDFHEIGTEIENYVKECEAGLASAEAAVFHDQETLYSGYFGYADRENQVPADKNTVYEWGSISKMFVWVSVMQLYEQGQIDLNADIRTYLPAGFLTKTAYDDPITMLHLMNHTAGWQETICSLETANEAEIVPLEYALKNTEPAQVHAPGEVTAYSNWGAALAGYIVQLVSGQNYAEYVHEHILQPLGMEHTSIGADYSDNMWVKEQREKLNSYLITDGAEQDFGQAISYILLYPAGSATGTLEDLTTFGKAFVSESTPLFTNSETLETMLSASAFFGHSDIPRNCHGLWTTQYAVDAVGHAGNTSSCSANLLFDPESRIGVAVVTNEVGETTFCNGIPALIYGSYTNHKRIHNAQITEKTDISGAYVSSRAFEKGFPKALTYLSFLPVMKTDSEDEFSVLGQATITRVANDQYYYDDGSGNTMLLFSMDRADGSTVLQLSMMDQVKDEKHFLKLGAIAVYLLMAVVCVILLIVRFIMFLVKRKNGESKSKMLPAIQILGILSAVVFVAYLLLGVVMITPSNNRIFCIIEAGISLFCLASALVLIKDSFMSKGTKVSTIMQYIFFSLYGLFVYGFTLYFELYNFWSC